MKRTISAMVGKGSVNHNSRKFHAENTDPSRSHLNVEYCNENIKDVYHELFDDAVDRYNEKQTRSDRRIDDYYEKIRTGKQEKLFHEVIFQIGNKDDMGATTKEGKLAAQVLDEYMKGFQERNPTLRVFSAHLHMDETTPHLHIDFVPYITGSKRGVDTRVSLKQALAALGFKGGTRRETEWNQWITSEKEQLALIMGQHEIEWEHLGTREDHLSVLDYKKQERSKEVAALEEQHSELSETISALESENAALQGQISDADTRLQETIEMLSDSEDKLDETESMIREAGDRLEVAESEADAAEKKARSQKKKLAALSANIDQVERYAVEYQRDPEEWLPEVGTMESAKNYKKRILPVVRQVTEIIRPLYAKYCEWKQKCSQLMNRNKDLTGRVDHLSDQNTALELENKRLRGCETDLYRLKAILGENTVDEAIKTAKAYEEQERQQREAALKEKRKHSRDAR